MKKLLGLMGGAMLLLNVHAQNIQSLSIGDSIPDLTFNNIVNYKSTSVKLSDFKDKLIIFDFWATWCTSCLGAIPHAQSMQKQFGDSIIVMLVNSRETRDTNEKITKLFKRQSRLKMPSITCDTMLTNLFPHREIPHYVWVRNQLVRAITSPKELTPTNIRSILGNRQKRLPVKNDFPNFNTNGALFTDTSVLGSIIEHSILTRYNDALQKTGHTGTIRDNSGLLKCIYFIDWTLERLYTMAYPMLKGYAYNRIVKESPALDSVYCYDLQLTPSNDEVFFQKMREDLNRAFHLIVEEEDRLTKCLIISKIGDMRTLFDTLMPPESTLDEYYDKRYIHNLPMSIFFAEMNSKSSIPVIDETGITSHITLDGLPVKLTDIPALKAALAPYGLDISYATRKLKLCVIKPEEKTANLTTKQNER